MREVVGMTKQSVTVLHRDEHDESGQYYLHHTILDDEIIERNKRIRLESLVTTQSKLGLHENERIEYAFSIPQMGWRFFQRDFPDIVDGLRSRDEEIRMKAARQLAILHPEWAVMAANR